MDPTKPILGISKDMLDLYSDYSSDPPQLQDRSIRNPPTTQKNTRPTQPK